MLKYYKISFQQKVIETFKETLSVNKTSELLELSHHLVGRILRLNDLKPIPYGKQKQIIKINPFKENDPLSEYWKGFLSADGNIFKNYISLELQEQDEGHIIKFSKFVGGSPIRSRIRKKFNKKQYSTVFSSKEIADYLQNLGITNKKSHTLKYNSKLNWDFIRGYFDGDGCICRKKSGQVQAIFYSGSLNFITQIKDFLFIEGIDLNIKCYDKRTGNNFYSLWITRKSHFILLYDKMYKNSIECLDRKKEKFKNIVNEIKIRNKRKSKSLL